MEQPSQGCGGVPITGGFQYVIRQGARQCHRGSLSQERLDEMIFWGVFQAGLMYDSMNHRLPCCTPEMRGKLSNREIEGGKFTASYPCEEM